MAERVELELKRLQCQGWRRSWSERLINVERSHVRRTRLELIEDRRATVRLAGFDDVKRS